MRNGTRRLSRVALVLVGGGISVSLLFWAKLRLVTQIPRTTYAEPSADERSPDHAPEELRNAGREGSRERDPGS